MGEVLNILKDFYEFKGTMQDVKLYSANELEKELYFRLIDAEDLNIQTEINKLYGMIEKFVTTKVKIWDIEMKELNVKHYVKYNNNFYFYYNNKFELIMEDK